MGWLRDHCSSPQHMKVADALEGNEVKSDKQYEAEAKAKHPALYKVVETGIRRMICSHCGIDISDVTDHVCH